MTSEELEHLGYEVELSETIDPLYVITLDWNKVFNPPRQIDVYLFDETHGPAMLDKLSTATYVGSAYTKNIPEKMYHFRHVTLPKKFRFAFDPPVQGLLKTSITRITPVFYELTIPKIDTVIGGMITRNAAWQKAAEIEKLGGFENYLDTLD